MRDRVQNPGRRIRAALLDFDQRTSTYFGPFCQLIQGQMRFPSGHGDGKPQCSDVRWRRGLGHMFQRNRCDLPCQCSILP
jgi:hypothetical protein